MCARACVGVCGRGAAARNPPPSLPPTPEQQPTNPPTHSSPPHHATTTSPHHHPCSRSERYGAPVIVLNLVKQQERRPRESVLAAEFAAAVAYLNRRLPPASRVRYAAFDLSRHAKAHGSRLRALLQQAQAPLAPARPEQAP